MENRHIGKFRQGITLMIIFALAAHVSILLFLTFSRSLEPLGKSLPANVYQHLIHLGPFFREDAIRSSDHFFAGTLDRGNWQYVDVTGKHVRDYQASPWQSHELTVRDFVRESAKALRRSRQPEKSPHFSRLLNLMEKDLPGFRSKDSAHWVHIVRWYVPAKDTYETDTLFQIKFKPGDDR